MIIDIHAHVCDTLAAVTNCQPLRSEKWGVARNGNKHIQFFPPSFENSNSPVEMLIAHMDLYGVDKALLMANPYYGYHNEYFIESVRKYPDRLKGVALVDLLKGQEAAEELAGLYDNTELFGFKIETASTFACAPGRHFGEKEFFPVWDVVNQYKQPAFLHIFYKQDIEDLQLLIRNFPDITYVICHMGADSCFGKGPDQSVEHFDTLIEMVKNNPQVWFDTSTVPVYYDEEYPFPTSTAFIRKAYEIVGAEKMMWATDYPGMLNHATYPELMHMVDRHCGIPDADLELIMGGNAQRLFFE